MKIWDGLESRVKILIAVSAAVVIIFLLFFYGIISFPAVTTAQDEEETAESIVTQEEDLEDGYYYIWSADTGFTICPEGTINWEDNNDVGHVIWFDAQEDGMIPTLYSDGAIIYVSSSSVPAEGIEWERFADYGYSIGVAQLCTDDSGHCYIPCNDDGYAGYINPLSDATDVSQFTGIASLYLDKIGGTDIREGGSLLSDGGTIIGLEKNCTYVCEWYTGTYYQDFSMTADSRVFCTLESFTTYEYEFLHSNCISITVPDYLKTGYYYIDGIGFFRYVGKEDESAYDGSPYDAGINWNVPIITDTDNPTVAEDGEVENQEEDGSTPEATDADGDDPLAEADGGAEAYEDSGE